MDVVIGAAEFDTLGLTDVHIGWCEFDGIGSTDVHVGWCEFDCASVSESVTTGGRGTPIRTSFSFKSSAPSAPAVAPSRYHGRYDDAEERAAAAELDDEEIVIALLLELF